MDWSSETRSELDWDEAVRKRRAMMRKTRGDFGIGAIVRFGVWFLLITERKGFCFVEEEEGLKEKT